MLAAYTFNSNYQPTNSERPHLPSLRLLEGGKFLPKQYSPVLVKEYNDIRLRFFKWGMIPAWAKGNKKVNPRLFTPASQVFSQPSFQLPIRRQRCLIPADGYYMEKATPRGTQTFKVSEREAGTFCFAGIYDTWRQPDGTMLQTFSILTTESNDKMSPFGLQMPLILPRNLEQAWLNPNTSLAKIELILQLPSAKPLCIHQVHELKEVELPGIIEHVAA